MIKSFSIFTSTHLGIVGPHAHPKYVDNRRLWQLMTYINRRFYLGA